jgi:hypothetical protein
VVRTPYSAEPFHRLGIEGLRKSDDLASNGWFEAERGTRQCDVSSPIRWSAVCDILLRARRIQKKNEHVKPAAASIDGVGILVDIWPRFSDTYISAHVFGLGDPTYLLRHRTLYVHGPSWTPIEVRMNTEWPIKVLGVLIVLDLSGISQLETRSLNYRKGETHCNAVPQKWRGRCMQSSQYLFRG